MEDVPYFNAPIYFANKQQIGKIDEIFGTYSNYFVSIKLNSEIKAKSFKVLDKVTLIYYNNYKSFIYKFLNSHTVLFYFSYISILRNCCH